MTTCDQCAICKYYWGLLECEAFPFGIPDKILTGEFNHCNPYPGDRGIRRECESDECDEIVQISTYFFKIIT